jgi:carbon monoxide dehydrogenase subunit G
MRIEKRSTLPFPVEKVWAALSNAELVGTCMPGVNSVEPVDDNNFIISITVKVGIIKPTFRINTAIVERNPPVSLRSTCVGEANGMMGSLRGTTEIVLTALDGGAGTQLDVQAEGDVFGRLGTFGYSVLKGKADQLWEQFVANLTGAVRLSAKEQVTGV